MGMGMTCQDISCLNRGIETERRKNAGKRDEGGEKRSLKKA
jgi:hypothetical protein